MCGPYPGAFEDRKNDQLLKCILSKGVDTFVCLQAEFYPDIPEEAWRAGIGLRPYFADAQRLSKKPLKWVQVPIVDGEIVADAVTATAVVELVEDLMAGRVVYLHCKGGHGRTGVIVCLILSYLYRISAAEALKRVQAYHDCRVEHQGTKSPQTVVQRDQVKRLVQELLGCEPPPVQIQPEAPSMEMDAAKRGSMKPNAKSSASCPALRVASDSSDAPIAVIVRRKPGMKYMYHENAIPEYLSLPSMEGASAAARRAAAMRQKAAAAAQRRRRFADPDGTTGVLESFSYAPRMICK